MTRGVGEREEVSGAGDREEDGAWRGVARPEGRCWSTPRRRRNPRPCSFAAVRTRRAAHVASGHDLGPVPLLSGIGKSVPVMKAVSRARRAHLRNVVDVYDVVAVMRDDETMDVVVSRGIRDAKRANRERGSVRHARTKRNDGERGHHGGTRRSHLGKGDIPSARS